MVTLKRVSRPQKKMRRALPAARRLGEAGAHRLGLGQRAAGRGGRQRPLEAGLGGVAPAERQLGLGEVELH